MRRPIFLFFAHCLQISIEKFVYEYICDRVVGRAVIPKTCLTLQISALAFTKALLKALPLSVSNIVLHTPCLVKTCVYNSEATASAATLFNGINITYMLNVSMTIRHYLLPKLSHRKGPKISARIYQKNHTIQDNAMVFY